MERRFLWVALGIAAVVVIAVVITALTQRSNPPPFNGSLISPPVAAADFALTGPGGQTLHLSDFRGKLVLLYFGYTHCPNECPTTVAALHKARAGLGAQADQVQVLLVTTDPARDTPEQLATYLREFDPTFIGLTGADADLQQVYRDYGVTVLDTGETHSTMVYVIDGSGNLRATLPYGLEPDQVRSDVQVILQGQ